MANTELQLSVELDDDLSLYLHVIREKMEHEEVFSYLEEIVRGAIKRKWEELVED